MKKQGTGCAICFVLLINKKVSELIIVKRYSCNADWFCFNTYFVCK